MELYIHDTIRTMDGRFWPTGDYTDKKYRIYIVKTILTSHTICSGYISSDIKPVTAGFVIKIWYPSWTIRTLIKFLSVSFDILKVGKIVHALWRKRSSVCELSAWWQKRNRKCSSDSISIKTLFIATQANTFFTRNYIIIIFLPAIRF